MGDRTDTFERPVGPRRRRRILRSTALLPAMCTLGNGLSGFGAIHFATKDALGAATVWHLAIAAWLIFLAMIFDMLDGRLARMTRRTSDFGAQLDSLCDMVSFGVAPAVLMLRMVIMVSRGQVERLSFLQGYLALERVIWCVAGAYVACVALRLARFNVESDPDESAHMVFRGLPSPGAAATIAALVLLFAHLTRIQAGWQSSPVPLCVVGVTLPIVTLATALLMVSRIGYPHVVNQYIRGRRPLGHLVKLLALILAVLWQPFITLAIVTLGYTLWGPLRYAWRTARRKRQPTNGDKPTTI